MQKVRFTKMHGAGNDYIYVDATRFEIERPEELAVAWSHRHTGIGSDGLVLIDQAPEGVEADFSMRIFNADGSEAMMCGNASRCIGKYLYERGLTKNTAIRLSTLSGVKTLHLTIGSDDRVENVEVDMLAPRFDADGQFTGTAGAPTSVVVDGRRFEGTFVSMGNPHFVMFVDDADIIDVARYGSQLERHTLFPQCCNIEFATAVAPDTIRTRVWERGSGITMACGTGACATAVAAATLGIASRRSNIVMDGGTLGIYWRESDGHVMLSGPAEFVFDGEAQVP